MRGGDPPDDPSPTKRLEPAGMGVDEAVKVAAGNAAVEPGLLQMGGNVWRMVTQKGAPSLAWRPTPLGHVFGDTRLRDLKPELKQFAVNAWRAPKRIFDAHPLDQYAQLRVDLRSPSPWARLPTPVAAKAGSVPTHE